jgi:hypothetical protein
VSAKESLLGQAREEFRAFKAVLEGLDAARLSQAWLGEWSVRDILAHISAWHRELGPALERMARGEKPILDGVSYEDVNAWNARFAAAKRDTPVAEVLKELDSSHEYFLAQAAKVPEERFDPGRTAYRIVDLNSAHHYKEHGDQIRAWRAARRI